MQAVTKRKKITAVDLRARVPVFARGLALFLLVGGAIFVGVSYYKMRNNTPFRLRSEAPSLSKEIVAITEGYERKITDKNRLSLWLRAARDVTYADGHHELEQVNLQVFPANTEKSDQIRSDRSIYDEKSGLLQFNGNVQIETHDALKVKTESLQFNQETKIAETQAVVNFERENVSGQSTGALVDNDKKRLELRSAVAVTVAPESLKDSKDKKPLPGARAKPVNIHSAQAIFEQTTMRLTFSGGATAEQEQDIMSGDTLTAILNDKKKLQKIEMRGNSYLRSMQPGHAAEAHAVDMDFYLDGDQRLQRAYGSRDIRAQTLNADSDIQLNGANVLDINFQAQGDQSVLKEMRTEGRSIATMSAPKSRANDPRAASKRLTADSIKMIWRLNGKDLERTEAVGNAELYVEPLQKTAQNDKKTLTGQRFDCDFYEAGNITKSCVVSGPAKAVLDPFQATDKHGARTMTSQKMFAYFVRETQDLEKVDAAGDAKFNELDRNGTANNIAYTAADQTVRLRGGDPTVWDSRARTKGAEIDSNNATHVSAVRGKVQTTYYSQEQTNGAAPFRKVKSPVYISGDRADVDHDSGRAVYSGSARMWQDDNYVRGDTITLYREQKQMESRGHVQSVLYQAKQKTATATETVPVFATAEFMRYSDPERLLHYENDVDIKQGTDRITAGVADVYLQKEGNEVDRTIAQRNVVIVQPGRRGTGDWCQYSTADEVAVLKGNPAHVEDAEQGTTDGNRLTMYRRENRVVVDDARGPQSPGRVRSTHKINKNP
jgi:LPS export ABC transporter protein LptC